MMAQVLVMIDLQHNSLRHRANSSFFILLRRVEIVSWDGALRGVWKGGFDGLRDRCA